MPGGEATDSRPARLVVHIVGRGVGDTASEACLRRHSRRFSVPMALTVKSGRVGDRGRDGGLRGNFTTTSGRSEAMR